MLKTDRWRKRRPADEIFRAPLAITGKTPQPPVPEVADVAEQGPAPGAVPAITGTPELDEFRAPFVQWFDSRIKLDAKAVALRTPPTWYTAVTDLHVAFSNWTLERNLLPPTEAQFRQLLDELCCAIRTVDGEEFVANVQLREDVSQLSPQQDAAAGDGPEYPIALRLPASEQRSLGEISELSELSTELAGELHEDIFARLVKEVVRLMDSGDALDDEDIVARLEAGGCVVALEDPKKALE
jgi:hypothetical protein